MTKLGGKVLGSRAYPFPDTTDFSSLLLQAKESGAKIAAALKGGTMSPQLAPARARIKLGARPVARRAAPPLRAAA